jgi:hypothetical protein
MRVIVMYINVILRYDGNKTVRTSKRLWVQGELNRSMAVNEAVFITPCHSVQYHCNTVMAQAKCRQAGTQLFIRTAYDTLQGRRLTLPEQFSVATKTKKSREGG